MATSRLQREEDERSERLGQRYPHDSDRQGRDSDYKPGTEPRTLFNQNVPATSTESAAAITLASD